MGHKLTGIILPQIMYIYLVYPGIDVCGLFFTNVKASDSDSVQRICKTRLCDAIEVCMC